MDNIKDAKILNYYTKHRKNAVLCVHGNSMMPVLQEGQTIRTVQKSNYTVGDILVFVYKNSEIIVHRLLKIQNERFYCKGDNSFRLEDIVANQIIGAVEIDDDKNNNEEFIRASLEINKIFRETGYNKENTLKTKQYQNYYEKYIKTNSFYKINEDMELLDIDDESMAIYDTKTGDTHYIDSVGKIVISSLVECQNELQVLNKLCSIYSAEKHEIEKDVKQFLQELKEKKVIIQI